MNFKLIECAQLALAIKGPLHLVEALAQRDAITGTLKARAIRIIAHGERRICIAEISSRWLRSHLRSRSPAH
jgi:hypothetical protein